MDSSALNTDVVAVAPARISDYMDLTPVDIVGKRCYQFIHAEDVEGIRQSHLDREYRTRPTVSQHRSRCRVVTGDLTDVDSRAL